MKFLWWAWKIIVNLLILLIVILVLDHLHERQEKLIIPVLGMLYVTIRTIGAATGLATLQFALAQQDQIDEVHRLLDGAFNPDRSDAKKEFQKYNTGWMIDGFFLFLISVCCALVFFTSL
jgi:ABC-type multidrug transport system permease subunit